MKICQKKTQGWIKFKNFYCSAPLEMCGSKIIHENIYIGLKLLIVI